MGKLDLQQGRVWLLQCLHKDLTNGGLPCHEKSNFQLRNAQDWRFLPTWQILVDIVSMCIHRGFSPQHYLYE